MELQGDQEDRKIFELVFENQMKLLEVETERDELLPKKALTLNEFNAIRSTFSGTDFERNSTMPMSVAVTSGVLWFVQRFFTKMKWRI